MATFVLVHGAWHGAWCWDRLVPELEALGHETITMDLPVDDGTATFHDYAAVVVDAAKNAPDDIVLVGHSLGSMVIPLVAAARPAAATVFLCGVIPNFAGRPWDDAPQMDKPGYFDKAVTNPDGSVSWPSVEAAAAAFYGTCAPEDAAWAFERLRPQNSASLWSAPYPLTEWPAAERISVVTTDDVVVSIEFSRHVGATRIGVEPIELPGDHSPFLADPARLARALDRAI